MAGLADSFAEIVDSLPEDWTDLELDLRIDDRSRYVDAAVMLSQINAMPYSQADWHWRIRTAHSFGHAAAPETVHGTLALLELIVQVLADSPFFGEGYGRSGPDSVAATRSGWGASGCCA